MAVVGGRDPRDGEQRMKIIWKINSHIQTFTDREEFLKTILRLMMGGFILGRDFVIDKEVAKEDKTTPPDVG
jgi:hypothetical protein